MNKYVTLTALALISAACSPTPTAAPLATNPSSSNNPIVLTPTAALPDALPTIAIQPTVVSTPETAGSLWLQILAPLNEAVVNTPQVDVSGSAPAGTVISINDEILIVDLDGQFKTTVSMEEGPNLIEIIASDESGNEIPMLLTITYEP